MKEFTLQKTGHLHAQGAPLYYEIAGPERPVSNIPILFIHAGVADCRMWDEQFAAFAPDYQLIRYDLRGFGKSAYPARGFANYEDPSLLLGYLNITRAHVVACSYGGKVAIDLALTNPDSVASLTLVAPSVGGLKSDEEVERFSEQEEALLEKGDVAGATELNMRMWVDGPKRSPQEVDPVVRQRVYEMQYQAFGVEIPEDADVINLDPAACERLREITAPTLAIVGDLDWPERFSIVSKLTDALPNVQTLTLEGGAHMVTMEQPEAFNQAVRDFIQSVK
ncbi:alpha/beta fold hydrolase [Ktedonobacter racemifer]|uniref:Alpha/beta hydrolase fold protein n=1 Tax=Ktedonobacter racemifer DSM 44963 TaxID=485913 RepID=D6TGK2_KTERA|nr:alpha/beta hydrolase [Ktedonobacter racemifer]EFH90714.1 alpha/beta hydrolase fold protein [Ktedonobacter racemifer DSM 44963]